MYPAYPQETFQIPNVDDRDGPQNIGFIQTSDMAYGLRRLDQI